MSLLKTAPFAIAISLATFAAGCDTMSSMGDRMRGEAKTDPSQRSEYLADYWKKNSSNGSMSREEAMGYKSPEGTNIEFSKADANQDNRISESEWKSYHGSPAQ